jgi:hypothetical protein
MDLSRGPVTTKSLGLHLLCGVSDQVGTTGCFSLKHMTEMALRSLGSNNVG